MCVTATVSSEVSSSSTPRTVTGRARSQFDAVNTKLAGTATAPVSPDDTATVTDPVGRVARRIVYVAVSPSATSTCWAENSRPGGTVSSSSTVTVTDPDTDP